MKKFVKNSIVLLFSFTLIACGHGKLQVKSIPTQGEVSFVSSSGKIDVVGNTPVSVDLQERYFSNDIAKLRISKKGFKDQIIYITKPQTRTDISVSSKLDRLSNVEELLSTKKLEELSVKIAQAQRFSYNKNYVEAEKVLLDLVSDYPDLSVPHDLLGNIYYLTTKSRKALYHYEQANDISPGNIKRGRLIRNLQRSIDRGE